MQVASNSSQHVELMLQESCTDQSGSLVVYTTVDVDSIQLAMSGEDSSCIPLLPLGFVVVPVEPIKQSNTTSGDGNGNGNVNGNSMSFSPEETNNIGVQNNSAGCLLTVGLQVLGSTIPSAKLNLSSVNAINSHLCNTVQQITAALSNGTVTGTGTSTSCPDNNNNSSIVLGSLQEPNRGGAPKQ